MNTAAKPEIVQPSSGDEFVSVRITRATYSRLEGLARRRQWSIAQAADWAISQFLKLQRLSRKGSWS